MIALVLVVGYAIGLVLDMLAGTLLRWPNRVIFCVFRHRTKKQEVKKAWKVDVWQVIESEANEARASKLTKMRLFAMFEASV